MNLFSGLEPHKTAQVELNAGNITKAENSLRDFIKMAATHRGKALTPQQAAFLTAYANNIIALIRRSSGSRYGAAPINRRRLITSLAR